MPSASLLRAQIEAALADRIPSALTPSPRVIRPVATTGIAEIDVLLEGGLPLGAITEMVGPESSGRTSVALSFIAQMTQAGKVCVWVDVSNVLHPESAAASGVDLSRLLLGHPRSASCATRVAVTNGFLSSREIPGSSTNQEGVAWWWLRPASTQRS